MERGAEQAAESSAYVFLYSDTSPSDDLAEQCSYRRTMLTQADLGELKVGGSGDAGGNSGKMKTEIFKDSSKALR